MHYAYLHGFASGPQSQKSCYFHAQLADLGIDLVRPDLNAPSFTTMTFSSQLKVIEAALSPFPGPITLIGSSMGGLLAILQAARDPRIECLVLMAPAFRFTERWSARMGEAAIAEWRRTGKLSLYHYAYRAECNLDIAMLDDSRLYDEEQLVRPVPTLILHGSRDAVVDPELSRDYARRHPQVTLQWFDTDHAMTDVLSQLWAQTATFCRLPVLKF